MVLLDSGLVAADTACCCDQCTTCDPIAFGAPCTDIDGGCHPIQNCDGTCSGPLVPCDSNWMTDHEDCSSILDPCDTTFFCESSVNPVTCEFTQTGPCDVCIAGTISSFSVLWVPCSDCTVEDCGACCNGDNCFISNETECTNRGFTFLGIGVPCDGAFCPV